jgi:2-polyprenyl-3-methyl-5-hydroxy-6-metoxy-1,4-benzoquinol methylase
MKDLWDSRYGTEEYAYGTEPNAFFSAQLKKLTPGRLLLPGEGEGRNAVYAASHGWSVDAFDQSSAGKSKAHALAAALGVKINYRVCALEDFHFPENHYDALGLIYFHADSRSREKLHRKASEALKPGGSIFLEAFHKQQLNNNTGGPKSLDMLFDEEILARDFEKLKILKLEKLQITLNEGPFHQGEASVIRFHGIKSNENDKSQR